MKNTKNRLEQIQNYILIVIVLASLLSFGSVQAAPAADEPLPTETVISIEATTEATPVVVEPTPTVVEPTAVVVEPTPVVEEPTPVVEEPTPVVEEPTPVVEEPTPVVVEPTPTEIIVPTEEPQPPQISWKVESGMAAESFGGAATPSISGQGTLDELRQALFGQNNTVDLLGGPTSLILKGQVTKGEELQLTIESNPSTGASWQISGMDATMMEQAGETYFTGGIRGRQGASQQQVIPLKAVNDGNAAVELIYRRPWEPAVKPRRFVTIEAANLKDVLDLTDPVKHDSLQKSEAEGMVNLPLAPPNQALPASFDWRTSGKVSSVKDQGYCGSCWAFSAAGTTESALMVQGGLSEMDLSEQYLVSCNTDGFTPTCDYGGIASDALDYHKLNGYKKSNQTQSGAVLESNFPYAELYNATGQVHACSSNFTKSYWLQQSARDSNLVAGYWWTIPTDAQIKAAIYTYGPISVAICAGPAMQGYTGGIFTTDEGSQCGIDDYDINHMVMLVGWNDAENTWIMKNSWGTAWGESGYMRIQRGISHIGSQSVYAIISTTVPAAPTPLTPSGAITTSNPTFTWTKPAGAINYALYVYTTTNVLKFANYVTPTCGVTTCTYTPTLNLPVDSYKWRVRAGSTGGWSAYSAWKYFNYTGLPAAPTPMSPSSVITTGNPTFTWTRPANVTQWALYVYTSANVLKFANYVTPTCNASTCSYTPTLNLTVGSYKWRVRAGNTYGWGAYSSWLNFALSEPAAPTPQSPSSVVYSGNPPFTWTMPAGVTQYALYVYTTANVLKFAQYVTPTCNASTCSYTPTLNLLTAGSYKWKVRAGNTYGWSAYSIWKTFTISAPAAPTPQSPSGAITTGNPAFTWTKPTGATNYALYVYTTANVLKFAQYVTPTCGESTCSYTPTLNLTAGSYKWRVRAGNTIGWSAYSAWLNFTVSAPAVPTPLDPNGTIPTGNPTFTWTRPAGVTNYALYVYTTANVLKFANYITPTCNASTCVYTPTLNLTAGNYKWAVRAGNTYGWSAYSTWLNFSVSSAGSGFDSQFNGSKTNWVTPTGDPTVWDVNATYLYTSGTAIGATSIYYNALFSSLDYTVKLKRIGVNYNNYLMFRGDPTNLDSYYDWQNSYSAGYTRDGYYSVWKCVSGYCSQLQAWTYTSAIAQGDSWNILRVKASGSTLRFYINGALVWTGTDTSFTTGYVGIETWNGGTLQVDYATLTTTVSGTTESDTISAEQAALNAAANQQRGINVSRMRAPTSK